MHLHSLDYKNESFPFSSMSPANNIPVGLGYFMKEHSKWMWKQQKNNMSCGKPGIIIIPLWFLGHTGRNYLKKTQSVGVTILSQSSVDVINYITDAMTE